MYVPRIRVLIGILSLILLIDFVFLPFRLAVAGVFAILALGIAFGLAVVGHGLVVVWTTSWRRRRGLPLQVPYLPNLPTSHEPDKSALVFSGKTYRVYLSEKGIVDLRDLNERPLVLGIRYYSQTDQYEVDGMEEGHWEIQHVDDDGLLILVGEVRHELVKLRFEFDQDGPCIKVQTFVEYRSDIRVKRSALFWDMAMPLTEVYRPSGARVTDDFETSYWLDRAGALFGQSSRGVWINHVPGVSSLQIDTGRRRLWVNLDYERDHPYVSIPFRQDGTAKWRDASAAEYKSGQARCNQWQMIVGEIPAMRPRIACHPNGCLASMVWTEHACHASIEVHRAVYFGHQSIQSADEAVAGFVKHRIPVTKSVHYSNVTRAPIGNGDPRPMIAIRSDDSEFLRFLEELHRVGDYEICLHCTDAVSSEREEIEASLRFVYERFGGSTWIDHIWCRPDGTVSGCRECFSCEGPIQGSKGHIADLWRRYQVRYFWNSALEYMVGCSLEEQPVTVAAIAGRGFRNVLKYLNQKRLSTASQEFWRWLERKMIDKRRSGSPWTKMVTNGQIHFENNLLKGMPFYMMSVAARSCGFPAPTLYQHPTLTEEFYHWPTWGCELGIRPATEWNRIYSEVELERFVETGETYILHSYPVFAQRVNGCIQIDSAGVRRVSPEFDSVLARMARLRDQGKLYLGTIQELMDYRRRLANVELSEGPEGTICISNHGEEAIEGFTLAFDTADVKIDTIQVKMKPGHGDWLYWFDLPAKGCVYARMQNAEMLLRRAA